MSSVHTEGLIPSTPDRLPTGRRRALLFALLVAVLALLVASDELHATLVAYLPAAETLIRQRPGLGALLVVAFAALSAMLAFLSSGLIVPVAVYVWGPTTSMLLLWTGWIVGGLTAYTLSRLLGRGVARAVGAHAALEPYERFFSRRAPFGLVLLFQAAVPSEIPGYLLGLLRYPLWKYLVALAITELPYAAATVYLGTGFVERRTLLLVLVGTAMAAFSGVALYALRRRLRREVPSGA